MAFGEELVEKLRKQVTEQKVARMAEQMSQELEKDKKRKQPKYSSIIEALAKPEILMKETFIYVPLEEYVRAIQNIPIVHKVYVLFDDRPKVVSIRVEYLEQLMHLDPDILQNSNEELTHVTREYRIEKCEQIVMSYVQKEVIR